MTRGPIQFGLGALLLTVSAWAQNAAVTGSIKNQGNAPLSGVSVSVANATTGSRSDATTDEQGAFRVGSLTPGDYQVEALYRGIKLQSKVQIVQSNQVVNLGSLELTVPTASNPNPAATQTAEAAAEQAAQPVREEVTVTARRVEEEVQSVPLPVSVIGGPLMQQTQAFNVNRLKELVPTVQFYSSNPRNTSINVRGLGSPYGLTNDGIEPGVGFYVDGVYYARTAAGTLDFLDLERIEVLRGPQGTLFGKNTTAGALSITSRRPSFVPETNFELNFGNLGFIQAKGSVSGPLTSKLAARVSFSGTQRDGMVYNVRTQKATNDQNNLGIRTQFLYTPKANLSILFAVDYTRQRPDGFAQVIAGVAPTLRAANRQYAQIAADLNYKAPSFNAFDRLTDTDTSWRSKQDMGGASVTLDWTIGKGTLTSITAWRAWNWDPSNDRDFIGLPVTTISAAPSKQRQWTQEVRYAATVNSKVNYLVGFFLFNQKLNTWPFHKQEQGSAAARFLLAPTPAALTPGLLDGYGMNINFDYNNTSTAAFGQVEYAITSKLRIIPGVRYNYDKKTLDYDQQVYGGLETTDPALLALKLSVLSPLTYKADVGDHNFSGQLTLAHKTTEKLNTYVTYATGFKSVGLNLGGVPTDALGNPILSAATVRPERVRHLEAGLKSQLRSNITANVSFFNTGVHDFQTQVVNAQVGVLRGYLANAEKVRVRGIEFDTNIRINPELVFYSSVAFTDGRYMSFKDAPPPLEDTGGPQVKDISGSVLPGISKWAFSAGAEYTKHRTFLSVPGQYFFRLDTSFRSRFSSNPTASRYLIAPAYGLLNPRVGFRTVDGWAISVWARNLTNSNYFELMQAQPGNSGLYVGLPGDYRTYGVTISRSFQFK